MNIDFNAGYVCGVLCADGTIEWRREYGNYWIALETVDDEFADKFLYTLSTLTDGNLKSYQSKRRYRGKKYITNNVVLRGKRFVKSFIDKWGVKAGTYTWRVPKLALKNQDFRRGFLQGFFDGDGSVNLRIRTHKNGSKQKRRSLRITSVNLKGLKQLKRLLKIEDIDCVIYPVKNHFFLDIDGKTRVTKFVEKINFGIRKKRQKIELGLDPVKFEEAMKL
jgi:intein-encoded DNA endonuclease-like protein